MKSIKRVLMLLSILIICSIGATSSVKAATKNVSLYPGDKCVFTIKNVSTSKTKYTTNNKNIATVNKKGEIKALKKGKAIIKAVYNKKTFKCNITVKALEKIQTTKSIKVIKGNKANLKVTTKSKRKVTFKTSNSKIATVNSKGVISTKKEGKTEITIYLNGIKCGTCKVTVIKKPQPSIIIPTGISCPKLTVYEKGKTYDLHCTINPSTATNKTIKYSVDDTSIATINSKGILTTKKAGTIYVTATSVANSKVTIKYPVKIFNYITKNINITNIKDITVDSTGYMPTISLSPSSIKLSNCKITSSDTKIVKIEANQIIPISAGKSIITITAPDGYKVKFTQNVLASKFENPYLSASISKKNIEVGQTEKITIQTNSKENITYKSLNQNIASVNGEGIITGANKGSAVIEITSGKLVTNVSVTIIEKDYDTFLLNKVNTSYLLANKEIALTYTSNKENIDSKITWKSSDSNIATVNNGIVNFKTIGEVKITATYDNGIHIFQSSVTINIIDEISIEYCDFEKESQNLTLGENITPKLLINPINAKVSISWESSNTKIATVSANGIVEGKEKGYTIITATIKGTDNLGNEKIMTRQCVIYVV